MCVFVQTRLNWTVLTIHYWNIGVVIMLVHMGKISWWLRCGTVCTQSFIDLMKRSNVCLIFSPEPTQRFLHLALVSEVQTGGIWSPNFCHLTGKLAGHSAVVFYIYSERENESWNDRCKKSMVGFDPWPPGLQEAQKEGTYIVDFWLHSHCSSDRPNLEFFQLENVIHFRSELLDQHNWGIMVVILYFHMDWLNILSSQ